METKLFESIYPKGQLNLSFAGCGFLGIYHVGVASCFKKYAPYVYKEKISGASAGALVACALIADCSLGDCTTFCLNLALECRKRYLGPFHPNFQLVRDLRKALNEFLPENAHVLATNKLFISLTRFPDLKNELVSKFNSKDELMDALICSSYVPFYSGVTPPFFQGRPYMDGAFSDNLPSLDNWTIKVSPFAGESDICPCDQSDSMHHITLSGTSTHLNRNNAYRARVAFLPPSPEILSQMCQNGFEDALRFMTKKGMITCQQHVSIHSAINSSHPFRLNMLDKQSVHRGNQRIINSVKEQRFKKDPVFIFKLNDADNVNGSDGNNIEDNFNMNHNPNHRYRDNNNNNNNHHDDTSNHHYHVNSDNNNNFNVNNNEDPGYNSDESHHHQCEECELMSKAIASEGPPSTIIRALDIACLEGNKGFFARFYSHHYLTYLAAPYIIPCSFTYAVCKRFLSWTPYAPDDVKWFANCAYNFLIDLFESDKIDAPILKNERLISWLSILGDFCGIKRSDKKEFYSLIFPDFDSKNEEANEEGNSERDEFNFKRKFSKLPEKEKVLMHVKQLEKVEDDVILVEQSSNFSTEDQSTKSINFSHIDSFDNCLHINKQINAVLSYCYLEDPNSKNVKVIEIMPLQI